METNKIYKVGIIISSQRFVRVGPQVAQFVLDTIQPTTQKEFILSKQPQPNVTFELVDIAQYNLPLVNEPGIPIQFKSSEEYKHERTRVCFRRISALDAFVFVSAQRNWGIPAELKNEINYLYHEWTGKPAMIVTYGGHQCAAQLKTVLGGMSVPVVEKMVGMAFPSPEFRVKAFKGEELGLDARNYTGPWAEHREDLVVACEDLLSKRRSFKGRVRVGFQYRPRGELTSQLPFNRPSRYSIAPYSEGQVSAENTRQTLYC